MAVGFILASSFSAQATIIGGVEFPNGEISFADKWSNYDTGTNAPNIAAQTPENTIGVPDNAGVSLGRGGSIVMEFVDNLLTGSGDSGLDLWVFEIGPDVEDTFVDVSEDGLVWTSVGKVFGATSGIDIDAFGFNIMSALKFVRLTDDPNEGQRSGFYVGADIDAVGAISTVLAPDPDPVNAPSMVLLFGLAFVAAMRKHAFKK